MLEGRRVLRGHRVVGVQVGMQYRKQKQQADEGRTSAKQTKMVSTIDCRTDETMAHMAKPTEAQAKNVSTTRLKVSGSWRGQLIRVSCEPMTRRQRQGRDAQTHRTAWDGGCVHRRNTPVQRRPRPSRAHPRWHLCSSCYRLPHPSVVSHPQSSYP